jgi:Zn-dependent protease
MPRTLYTKNAVPPRVHILRSLGGPLYNFLGLVLSVIWRSGSPSDSLSHELAETTAVTHAALAFASLLPIPVVDGGVILKWALVLRGHPPAQAGQIVNRASIGLGAAALGAGAFLLAAGRRTLGALVVGGGALAAAAGLEWLR